MICAQSCEDGNDYDAHKVPWDIYEPKWKDEPKRGKHFVDNLIAPLIWHIVVIIFYFCSFIAGTGSFAHGSWARSMHPFDALLIRCALFLHTRI